MDLVARMLPQSMLSLYARIKNCTLFVDLSRAKASADLALGGALPLSMCLPLSMRLPLWIVFSFEFLCRSTCSIL